MLTRNNSIYINENYSIDFQQFAFPERLRDLLNEKQNMEKEFEDSYFKLVKYSISLNDLCQKLKYQEDEVYSNIKLLPNTKTSIINFTLLLSAFTSGYINELKMINGEIKSSITRFKERIENKKDFNPIFQSLWSKLQMDASNYLNFYNKLNAHSKEYSLLCQGGKTEINTFRRNSSSASISYNNEKMIGTRKRIDTAYNEIFQSEQIMIELHKNTILSKETFIRQLIGFIDNLQELNESINFVIHESQNSIYSSLNSHIQSLKTFFQDNLTLSNNIASEDKSDMNGFYVPDDLEYILFADHIHTKIDDIKDNELIQIMVYKRSLSILKLVKDYYIGIQASLSQDNEILKPEKILIFTLFVSEITRVIESISIFIKELEKIQEDQYKRYLVQVNNHSIFRDKYLGSMKRGNNISKESLKDAILSTISEMNQVYFDFCELEQNIIKKCQNELSNFFNSCLAELNAIGDVSKIFISSLKINFTFDVAGFKTYLEQEIKSNEEFIPLLNIDDLNSGRLLEYQEKQNFLDNPISARTNKSSYLDDEIIISKFQCAMKDKILLQGTLKITNHKIIFHSHFNSSNIFFGETKLIIPLEDIIRLEKKSHALIFDNSISVYTNKGELFFTSFISRDKAFNLISELLQKQFISEIPIVSQNSILNVEKEIDKTMKKAFKISITKEILEREERLSKLVNSFHADFTMSYKLPREYDIVKAYRLFFSDENLEIDGSIYHGFRNYLRIVFNKNFDLVINDLKPEIPEFFNNRKKPEEITKFIDYSERNESYFHDTGSKIPLCPKVCHVFENQRAYWISHRYVALESIVETKKVPLSDKFKMRFLYSIKEDDDGVILLKMDFSFIEVKKSILLIPVKKAVYNENKEIYEKMFFPNVKKIAELKKDFDLFSKNTDSPINNISFKKKQNSKEKDFSRLNTENKTDFLENNKQSEELNFLKNQNQRLRILLISCIALIFIWTIKTVINK